MPRQSILASERQALRQFYYETRPRPSQKTLVEQFFSKFNKKISQSTVSESLSKAFNWLNKEDQQVQINARNRKAQWPRLKKVLFAQQQNVQARGSYVSQDLLLEKAKQIWSLLPEYQGLPCPDFSIGWLQKFRRRFKIRQYKSYGEIASVPATAEAEIQDLFEICSQYGEDDIYNIDKIGLYWRQAILKGLATAALPSVKRDKSRISLALYTNASGSHKFKPWLIGKLKIPRALKGVNITALSAIWRALKKAQINREIFKEWL